MCAIKSYKTNDCFALIQDYCITTLRLGVRLDCPLSSCKDIQGLATYIIYMKPSLLTVSPPLLFQKSSGDGFSAPDALLCFKFNLICNF